MKWDRWFLRRSRNLAGHNRWPPVNLVGHCGEDIIYSILEMLTCVFFEAYYTPIGPRSISSSAFYRTFLAIWGYTAHFQAHPRALKPSATSIFEAIKQFEE
jgi:hypothetical protein